MNRSYYYSGIFLIVLQMVLSIFQSTLNFQLGYRVSHLPSFLPWFVLCVSIYFAGSLVALKYYQFKRFRTVFLLGVLSLLISNFQYYVIYNMLLNREMDRFYLPSYYAVLVSTVVFSLSIIFSDAGRLPWLKSGGVFSVIVGVILLVTLIIPRYSDDLALRVMLEKVNQWASWSGTLIPVLFIINFWIELREDVISESQKKSVNVFLVSIGIIAFTVVVYFGKMLTDESLALLHYNFVSERAKGLAQPFEARFYINNENDTLRYRLLRPLHYNLNQKYPLVVLLHHGGSHGSDNVKQVEGTFAPFLSDYNNIRKYPAFLFVPQCPDGSSFLSPAIELLTFEAMHELEQEFTIDTNRRYVVGLSGGGFGSWHFLGTHPKTFAAAIPICGGGDPWRAQNITDVAVWAFHGAQDALAPVRGSRDMIAAIRKAGGKPRYTEFSDAGHDIAYQVQSTPGLVDWLFAQKRN